MPCYTYRRTGRRALALVMRLTTNRSADMPMMAALMASTLDTQAVLRGRE
jgi:hypothetical protein